MAKKRYITTHSNFTLSRKHQKTKDGVIYERDWATISGMDGFSPGQVPVYGQSGFKMTIRNGINGQKKHRYGNWVPNDGTCSNLNVWTLECLGEDTITTDGKIVLKPNYGSLLDFVYFGSAIDLIKTSVSNIIKLFPAELYFSDKQITYFKSDIDDTIVLLGEDKGATYLVDNPFLLDIITKSIANLNVDNPLRYFCEYGNSYEFFIDENNKQAISWKGIIEKSDKKCFVNGDWVSTIDMGVCKIYEYYLNNQTYLMHDGSFIGYHIRPNDEEIESFFEKLDDFERTLLNRDSKPIYKAVLDTPRETDYGIISYKDEYIWPIKNGWNIDITGSMAYSSYINRLIDIAEFYDEYYTDNLWRSLTHESIKNFDHTDVSDENKQENYRLSSARMENLFHGYGRQFDELKRYIDNIKFINQITYDKKNNLPDYFLTDTLSLMGWEISTTMSSNDHSITTDTPLYDGETKLYSIVDAHIEFLRRLKLNSRALLSAKGTKRGVEMMLNLFGIPRNSYTLDEYYVVAKNGFNNVTNVELYNPLKNTFIDESHESIEETNLLQGLPIKEVQVIDDNGVVIEDYIIPWFDKLQKIDGNPYFQMKGGWGKVSQKEINLEITPDIKVIKTDDNVSIYDETNKYIKIVNGLVDLIELPTQVLSEGDIYYVFDITDIATRYDGWTPTMKASNYFKLNNVDNTNILGVDGWENIVETDIINNTGNGVKVLYIESIIDNNNGNNPHIGFGKYDDGKEYLDYFRQLFKYSLENDNFNEDAQDYLDNIATIGFELEYQRDNKKCWYFTDILRTPSTLGIIEDDKIVPDNTHLIGSATNYTLSVHSNEIKPDYYKDYVGLNLREVDLIPVNPEIGKPQYDEASANSLINVKTFVITNKFSDNIYFTKYFNDIIMPYVKQMIPSTTILLLDLYGKNLKPQSDGTWRYMG